MKQKLSLKQIFSVFKREYTEWITNPRMLVCLVVLVMIREIVILPLKNYAFTLAQPINALEPVIAVANSGIMLLLIPLVFSIAILLKSVSFLISVIRKFKTNFISCDTSEKLSDSEVVQDNEVKEMESV